MQQRLPVWKFPVIFDVKMPIIPQPKFRKVHCSTASYSNSNFPKQWTEKEVLWEQHQKIMINYYESNQKCTQICQQLLPFLGDNSWPARVNAASRHVSTATIRAGSKGTCCS